MKLTETVLSIKKLSKTFGRIKAVDELSFDVKRASIYGILGPNGSGKTTTLGITLGIINADQGSYSWFNNHNSKLNRKKIGAILEQPLFYPYLSARKNLEIFADIKDVNYDNIEKVLKDVNLYERRKDKFKTFSFGMKQRLALAGALLSNPEVLLLDEPTNGLDPQGIMETRELLKKINSKGVTIILSSHLLDEVQKICTDVIVINKGKKVASGNVNEVLSETSVIELRSDDLQKLYEAIVNYNKIKSAVIETDKVVIKTHNDIKAAEINNYLFSKGITLNHLSIKKKNLEKYFLEQLSNNN